LKIWKWEVWGLSQNCHQFSSKLPPKSENEMKRIPFKDLVEKYGFRRNNQYGFHIMREFEMVCLGGGDSQAVVKIKDEFILLKSPPPVSWEICLKEKEIRFTEKEDKAFVISPTEVFVFKLNGKL